MLLLTSSSTAGPLTTACLLLTVPTSSTVRLHPRYIYYHRCLVIRSSSRRLRSSRYVSNDKTAAPSPLYVLCERYTYSSETHSFENCTPISVYDRSSIHRQGSAATSAVGINIHLALSRRCLSVRRIFRSVADVQSSTSPAPSTQRQFQAYFNQPTKLTLAFVRDLVDIRRLARLGFDIPVETLSTNDVFTASHVDASDSNVTAVISLGCPV